MNKKLTKEIKHDFTVAGILAAVFFMFTVTLKWLDVRPIGVNYTDVSWAGLNGALNKLFGTHPFWDKFTNVMLFIAFLTGAYFAMTGLIQLIKTKDFKKVDPTLYLLAGFYIVMLLCFLFFECITVNYRPVLIDGQPKSSYPSSHTLCVCCIMSTAISRFKRTLKNDKLCIGLNAGCVGVIFFTVLGRMLSGMHWFTDILGAVLLSIVLYKLYMACYKVMKSGYDPVSEVKGLLPLLQRKKKDK